MTVRDLPIEDHEALMATHASRQLALDLIERHRRRASDSDEAVSGMRGVAVVATFVLGAIIAALVPVAAAIVRNAPTLYAAALPIVHQVLGWL